jgi:hypothetical protein
MKRSPQLEATLSELEKHGAEVLAINDSAKHIRIDFTYEGRDRFIMAGNNAASWNAPNAARRDVRRQLGIKRAKVTGRRRARRSTANHAAPTPPEHFTLLADPWRSILGTSIAQQTAAYAADQAWARLFGLCLLNTGHVPVNPAARHALGIPA